MVLCITTLLWCFSFWFGLILWLLYSLVALSVIVGLRLGACCVLV